MAQRISKPILFAGREFQAYEGSEDPAEAVQRAHESAHALVVLLRHADYETLARASTPDDDMVTAMAELWSVAAPETLPGALWRLYLVRQLLRQQSEHTADAYSRGAATTLTSDMVVAGAVAGCTPDEIETIAHAILRGVYRGDFGVACDRAAALCRIVAKGNLTLVSEWESQPEREALCASLTTQSSRLAEIARDLTGCARLFRAGALR